MQTAQVGIRVKLAPVLLLVHIRSALLRPDLKWNQGRGDASFNGRVGLEPRRVRHLAVIVLVCVGITVCLRVAVLGKVTMLTACDVSAAPEDFPAFDVRRITALCTPGGALAHSTRQNAM